MKKPRSLPVVFASIRAEYFPRWDREHAWRVKASTFLDGLGVCHKERKLIVLHPDAEWDSASMRQTLIHEICHAVTQRPHGKCWNRRMMKVAECAERRGDLELSRLLKEDVEEYQSTPFLTREEVYRQIEAWTLESPDCSWQDMLRHVAGDLRISQSCLLREFPKAKAVYKEALQFAQEAKASGWLKS